MNGKIMMKMKTSTFLSAALVLATATAGFVQQAAAEEATAATEQPTVATEEQPTVATEPTAETEATAAEQIESQLSLGEDASVDPELGTPYTKEVIGDWEMRCIKSTQEVDPCQMYQLMDDGEGIPVAEFSLFRLPEGGKAKAGATVVVPLETALPNQLTISVDGGSARRYPYLFCNPVGCYARIGLTDADLAVFKKGNKADITIIPALAPDQEVVLSLSLKGFTDSYKKVSVIAP